MSVTPFWGDVGMKKWSFLAKNAHLYVPKNDTSGARTKILRPLLKGQHPLKMMELPFVLSVYHFWMGFQPIFEFATFLAFFTL